MGTEDMDGAEKAAESMHGSVESLRESLRLLKAAILLAEMPKR